MDTAFHGKEPLECHNSCDHYYILCHVLTLTKSVLKSGCALDTQWITLVEEIQNFSPSRHTLYPMPDWKMKQWWLTSVITETGVY